MDFNDLKKITNDAERTNNVYKIFNENTRLHSKSARVEFITTTKYIEKYLTPTSKIIDIGAGAGEYSLHFAGLGNHVTAVELADDNIAAFKAKLTPDIKIDLHQGNACDLSLFSDNSFDIVLLLGPLYHISTPADRAKCIEEARRICKPGGVIFFAYISNDMVILTQTFFYDLNYFKDGDYNHETFAANNFPFIFFTVSEARDELKKMGINIIHEVAADGVSELLSEKINALDEYSYNQYLRYHLYTCEKPEMFGHSNHLLFVGKN